MSTPMPRPAPVTNQTLLSLMLVHCFCLTHRSSCATALSVVHCNRTTRRPRVGAPDDGATDRDPLHSGSVVMRKQMALHQPGRDLPTVARSLAGLGLGQLIIGRLPDASGASGRCWTAAARHGRSGSAPDPACGWLLQCVPGSVEQARLNSVRREAAVHREGHAEYEAGGRAAQPQCCPGDLVGSAGRPIGWSRMISFIASGWFSIMSEDMGVSITPGHTALMRMPSGAYRSRRSWSARSRRAWLRGRWPGPPGRPDRRARNS